jgi:Dolichyl-phosphate-mannose-protein mannosyltransferase
VVTPPDLVTPAQAGQAAPARPVRRAAAAWHLYDRVRPGLPLAAVLVVAAVLRTWAIGAVGFNSDETVYAGQAGAIAGDPLISPLFPVFRAHPLLFQTLLSLVYRAGGGDVAARLLVAALGVATVLVVHRLGRLLYGPRVGLVAALLLALMPYHVGVSRQVLLDVPMTFLATVTLYAFARFLVGRATRWLIVAGLLLGFTVLTKETAVLFVGGLVVFGILYPGVRPGIRQSVVALAVAGGVMLALPISLQLAGRVGTGQSYLAWQLLRRSNHTLLFYAEVVPPAIGFGVIAAAVAGLWFLRRSGGWREGLLVCWAAVPVAFYQLWPTKGFQYLLVVAPVAALLAARALVFLPVPGLMSPQRRDLRVVARAAVVVALSTSLAVPSWNLVEPQPTTTFLAGSGGLPAGREMGRWIDANIPQGARVMTIGPSTANIVRFYGHRPAVGLSVSPNPLSRNPSYEPIENPDRELRQATIQYVVWDAYTAGRSPFFADRLMRYVTKYRGVALHTETIRIRGAGGAEIDKPVMTVYEVRP